MRPRKQAVAHALAFFLMAAAAGFEPTVGKKCSHGIENGEIKVTRGWGKPDNCPPSPNLPNRLDRYVSCFGSIRSVSTIRHARNRFQL
jgi:hypothetical protein